MAIARALISHPSIILADEANAAPDSKSGRDVVEIMQRPPLIFTIGRVDKEVKYLSTPDLI